MNYEDMLAELEASTAAAETEKSEHDPVIAATTAALQEKQGALNADPTNELLIIEHENAQNAHDAAARKARRLRGKADDLRAKLNGLIAQEDHWKKLIETVDVLKSIMTKLEPEEQAALLQAFRKVMPPGHAFEGIFKQEFGNS